MSRIDPATAADVRADIVADIKTLANRYLADVGPEAYDATAHRALLRAAEIAAGYYVPSAMTGDCLDLLIPPPSRARERAAFADLLDAEGNEQS